MRTLAMQAKHPDRSTQIATSPNNADFTPIRTLPMYPWAAAEKPRKLLDVHIKALTG